jgi:DNA polymerase-1
VINLAFDIESHDSELLWSMGPEFFRVAGYSTGQGVRITTDPHELNRNLTSPLVDAIAGSHIMGFDLPVLRKICGFDIVEAAERGRLRDSMLIAFYRDPPPAQMNTGQIQRYFNLSNTAKRVLNDVKHTDASKALVKEYGSWGAIPVDDARFASYLHTDVELAGNVTSALCGPEWDMPPYLFREHRIAALGAIITMNGFRVDDELVLKRYEAGELKRRTILERLTQDFGLPTVRKDGSPSKAPQNTQEGRLAVKRAFEAVGAKHMPKTDKGAWGTGKEAMNKMIEHYGSPKGGLSDRRQQSVRDLAETIQSLNGIRTVYETTKKYMVEDGDGSWRVHPAVDARQASGRLSFTKPGLTVMGKRGGRHHEREIFLPEPGHVIVCADLSQIDARAVAVLSQDQGYMDLFGPGADLHAEVAKRVFGNADLREMAKPLNHGYNYGLGARKVIDTMGLDPKVVFQFYEQMQRQFPRLMEWKAEIAEIAAQGHLLDNGWGRRMRPEPRRAYTQGPALMGQGCARDLMMEGMLRLPREIHPMLRGVIHDEVVCSVPIDIVDDVEKAIVKAFTFEWAPPKMPNARPIQIVADVGNRGTSWGNVYEK